MTAPQTSHKSLRLLRGFTGFAGLALIIVALLLELLPGTSPGIGTGQLVMLFVGMLLLAFAILASGSLRTIALMTLVFIGVSACLMEFGLALSGVSPDFTAEILAAAPPAHPLTYSPYWQCDTDQGCRFVPGQDDPETCEDAVTARLCQINSAGYRDDEFDEVVLTDAKYRILMLGDSFTFGTSASPGQSFVEQLERRLGDSVAIWNMGVSGTGTKQALQLAQRYVPIMQPDLVILGFFENDFQDNLYPPDLFVRVENLPGGVIYAYDITDYPTTRRLSETEIYYRAHSVHAPVDDIDRLLRQTRTGTLLANAWRNLQNAPQAQLIEQAQNVTTNLLQDLRDYLAENNVKFIVMPIMQKQLLADNQPIQTAPFYDIAEQLALNTLDMTLADFTTADYDNTARPHWNNAGHSKAADLLEICIRIMIETDTHCSQLEPFSEGLQK